MIQMYKIEPPEEVKADMVKYFNTMRGKIYAPHKVKIYFLTVYYRYVEPILPGETVEGKVKKGLRCNVCFQTAFEYFKNKIKAYEEDRRTN